MPLEDRRHSTRPGYHNRLAWLIDKPTAHSRLQHEKQFLPKACPAPEAGARDSRKGHFLQVYGKHQEGQAAEPQQPLGAMQFPVLVSSQAWT